MHQSSLILMKQFREKYLKERESTSLSILDLGALNINGSYKPIFNFPHWNYVGVDQVPGNGVDTVLKKPYFWNEIKSSSFDVVISGQTFEHSEYFWLSILEIHRVLKPGGLCCIIAPSSGHIHRYPFDCYRFLPDGMQAIAKFAGLEILETSTPSISDTSFSDSSTEWKDSMLIARKKSKDKLYRRIKKRLFSFSIKWLGDYR